LKREKSLATLAHLTSRQLSSLSFPLPLLFSMGKQLQLELTLLSVSSAAVLLLAANF
jgi:hypothetical protein